MKKTINDCHWLSLERSESFGAWVKWCECPTNLNLHCERTEGTETEFCPDFESCREYNLKKVKERIERKTDKKVQLEFE